MNMIDTASAKGRTTSLTTKPTAIVERDHHIVVIKLPPDVVHPRFKILPDLDRHEATDRATAQDLQIKVLSDVIHHGPTDQLRDTQENSTAHLYSWTGNMSRHTSSRITPEADNIAT